MDELGYEAAAHNAAKQAHAALSDAPKRQQALEQAQTAVATLQTTLTDLAAQLTAQQQTVTDLETQKEAAVAQLAALQADGGDLRAVENEVMDLREEEVAANLHRGRSPAAAQRVGRFAQTARAVPGRSRRQDAPGTAAQAAGKGVRTGWRAGAAHRTRPAGNRGAGQCLVGTAHRRRDARQL
ncbi:MAG: hypothetical protein M5U34_48240 [Chloroflexi bacterium]|nr:hypothetical protein [Chloroflexota bacterium]